MTPERARVRPLLLLLVAALALPRVAGAVAAGWSIPSYLSTDGRTALAPSLGMLGDGTPVATWAEQTPTGWFPVMASRPIMGEWSPPYAISSGPIDAPGVYSFGPRMGIASSGSFLAAWLVHRDQPKGDGTFVHQAVVEGATGTIGPGGAPGFGEYFFAGRHPPNGFFYEHTPHVFLTPDGNGVVHYPYRNCCGGTFIGLTGIAGAQPTGTAGDPQTSILSHFQGGTNDDANPSIPAFATAGRSAGWTTAANPLMAVAVTRATYVENPTNAELFTTENPSSWPTSGIVLPLPGFGTSLGITADGRVLATAPKDGRLLLWRTGDGTARVVDDDTGNATNKAAIATFWDGSATIAYMAQDSEHGVFRIRVVQVSGIGSVTPPRDVSGSEGVARNPVVAYDPDGTVHVVWSQGAGTIGNETAGFGTGVYASYKLPDGEFLAVPSTVITGVTAAHAPRIAVDKDGRVTVVAQVHDGTRWRIASFTHDNPAIPKNEVPPVIGWDGPLNAGTVVACDEGTWTADPTSYAFQWLLDGVPQGPSSPVATRTVTAGDLGHVLVCHVIAANPFGSGQADSAPVALTAGGGPGGGGGDLVVDPNAIIDGTGIRATLNVAVPGPGTLNAGSPAPAPQARSALAAARKKRQTPPLLEPASMRVEAAGTVPLTVTLAKAGKKKLKKKRKKGIVVPVRIDFTPDAGTAGVAVVDVTFKKPRKGGK
ncbi:MAG: hypothetical protein KIT14_08650 [bacterium]|nr:hypothetical protein [bacterium]